jgi:hypothetical protein
MFKNFIALITYFLLIVISSSCDKLTPESRVPSYIKIDSVIVESPSSAYNVTQNINDVWIDLNAQRQGIYELPACFPIIAEGKENLTILAGIKKNGIATSRCTYPFYSFYDIDTTFIATDTLHITPVFHYIENINIWHEDFEDAGIKLTTTSKSNSTLKRDTINADNHVGFFQVSSDKKNFQCATNNHFVFPTSKQNIYMELDYKCDDEFVVGLFIETNTQVIETPILTINPHPNDFNKIYIDLTQAVSSHPEANSFKIFIGASYYEVSNPKYYIDNLMILYP